MADQTTTLDETQGKTTGQAQVSDRRQGQTVAEARANILAKYGIGIDREAQDSNSGEQANDQTVTEEETQGQETAETSQAPETSQEKVITEDEAKAFPDLKNFIGKPLSAYLKSVQEREEKRLRLANENTEYRRTLSELKAEIENLKNQLTKQPSVQDEEIPDAVSEPEKFKEYMKQLRARLKEEAKAEVLKEIKPVVEPIERLRQQEEEKRFISTLQSQLPEGLDWQEAVQTFAQAQIQGGVSPDELREHYSKVPMSVLANDVISFHKILYLQKQLENKEITSANLKQKKVTEAIREKSKEAEEQQQRVANASAGKPKTPVQEARENLIRKHAAKTGIGLP